MAKHQKTIKEKLEKLRRECQIRNFSKKTIKNYYYITKGYLEMLAKKELQPNLNSIKEYIITKKNEGLKGSSINTHIRAIKFYIYHIEDKELRWKKIPTLKEEIKPVEMLSLQEVKKLLKQAKGKTKIAIHLLYGSGLRPEEAISYKWEWFEKQIVKGKGNKTRNIIMSEKTKKLLKEHKKNQERQGINTEYVFASGKKHITTRTLQRWFKKLLEKCDIKKNVGPHILRKSFVSHLQHFGEDIVAIQKLVGHSKIETTQKNYTAFSKKWLEMKSPLDH